MTLDTSGNLGIGTTSPVTGLHVKGAYPTGFATIERTGVNGGGPGSVVTFKNDGKTAGDGVILNIAGLDSADNEQAYAQIRSKIISPTSTSEAGEMQFWTTTAGSITQKMVVDSSGNVGIGTSSPSAKLHVSGTASTFIITESTAAATSGSVYNILKSDTGAGGNYYRAILGQDAAGNYDWGIGNFGVTSATKTNLVFYAGGLTERMRIDSSGNVGIGTTSPAAKLQIQQSDGTSYVQIAPAAAYDPSVKFFRDTASNVGIGRMVWNAKNDSNVDTQYASLQAVRTSSTTGRLDIMGMSLLSDNTVGIGTTSPAAKLTVGDASEAGGSSVGTGQISLQGAGGLVANYGKPAVYHRTGIGLSLYSDYRIGFEIKTGASSKTDAMMITESGNVGIGTTSPAGKIDCVTGSTGQPIYFRREDNGNQNVQIYNDSGGGYVAMGGSVGKEFTIKNLNALAINVIAGSNGVYLANAATSWASLSDERTKDIIENITDAATKVSSLRAVIGKYKTDSEGTRRSFLIAQDVQAVLPEAVDATNPDKLGLQYSDVIPLLVASIKELTQRVAALESK
jgi:hypothetical protein